MVAARLATLKRGDVKTQRDSSGVSIDTPSIDDAASLLSVGRASVARAKQVIEHGSNAIVDAVESGEIPVSFAAKFVTEEPDKKTQTELVKQGKKAMKEHITEPSPFVDDIQEREEASSVAYIKQRWGSWSDVQREAARVWIEDQLRGSR
jgi:hypothetical protein